LVAVAKVLAAATKILSVGPSQFVVATKPFFNVHKLLILRTI